MAVSKAGGPFQCVIWDVESQNILVGADIVIFVHGMNLRTSGQGAVDNEPSRHFFFVALAAFIELKRRPGDGRIEERSTNNRDSMALAEQPQRLLGIALDNDDIWRLVTVLRQSACTHFLANIINLRKIENVVDDAHDVDDVTTTVGHNSL